jgi:enterochelin esterase family protein
MTDNQTEYLPAPEFTVRQGVPYGILTEYSQVSEIYPGVKHAYWVYVPAQYDPAVPANVMVFQDGWSYCDPSGELCAPKAFDNMIHNKELPVTIGIFVNPGEETQEWKDDTRDWYHKYPLSQRAREYDVMNCRYAGWLMEEILPEVGKLYNLTDDPECRAICGMSSGGICSWTVAWERPDAFRKVLSHVGSFADIMGGHNYPFIVRKSDPKPIRIFLQAGTNDIDNGWGSWELANRQMASALAFKGYDYKLVVGHGGHDLKHAASIFADSLRWLWR